MIDHFFSIDLVWGFYKVWPWAALSPFRRELPASIVSAKVNSKTVFLLPSHVDLKDGAAGSLPNVDDTSHFCAV